MTHNGRMQTVTPIKNLRSLAACLLVLVAGFFVYGATGHDDAHITFWPAYTLSTWGNISNYNGEHIQQSSTLLLTLLIAGIHFLADTDIPATGFSIGILASAGCCILLAYISSSTSLKYPLYTALLLLSTPSFLLWTYSGMESTLCALCLLACSWSWWRWIDARLSTVRLFAAVLLCTSLLMLSRPEMPLITIAVASCMAFFYWFEPIRRVRCLQLLLISTLAAAALFSWQKLYFGSWLPLPVVAKQGGNFLEKFNAGYIYLLFSSGMNPVLLLALLVTPWVWWQQRKQKTSDSPNQAMLALAAVFIIVYTGFIWTAGGDWMQAGRFLVPMLPVVALMLTAAASQLQRRWLAQTLLGALCFLQFGMQYVAVAKLSKGIPVWAQYHIAPQHEHYSNFEKLNQEHLRDMAVIDHLAAIIPPLREKLGRPVVLMSGQAGMVFYYTAQRFGGDVIFRDLHGLVEGSLTNCPAVKTVRRGQLGLAWDYKEFFGQLTALQSVCNVAIPDIIYDLNDMSRKTGRDMESLGYTILHQETGFPVENRTPLPYNRLYAPNLIFVRSELASLLGNPPKRVIDYRHLPLQSRWPMTLLTPTNE